MRFAMLGIDSQNIVKCYFAVFKMYAFTGPACFRQRTQKYRPSFVQSFNERKGGFNRSILRVRKNRPSVLICTVSGLVFLP